MKTQHLVRHFLPVVMFMVSCLLVVGFASCRAVSGPGLTPNRVAFVTVDGATDAINGISDARAMGLISPSEYKKLLPFIDAVFAAQKDVDKALLDSTLSMDTARQALTDALVELINQEVVAKKATALAARAGRVD